MGWRYRKSIHIGGGMRINISNSGVGFSYGVQGFRKSIMPNGRVRTTYSIPGTGISYVEEQKHGNHQEKQQGTYSEYNTSITGMETTAVYQKLADECNAWIRMALKQLCLLALELAVCVALGYWLINFKDAFEAAVKISFLALAGVLGICDSVNKLSKSKVTMVYELPKDNMEYAAMLNFVQQLATSCKLQHLYGKTDGLRRRTNAGASTNLSLQNIRISQAAPKMISTNIKCYRVRMVRNSLYLFPDMMMLVEKGKLRIISYKDISVKHSIHDIIDHGPKAKDAEVIGYRWQYSNNDGSPDRRFNNNRQVPVCRNGQLTLVLPNSAQLHIVGSNKTAMKTAAMYLQKLCELKKVEIEHKLPPKKSDTDHLQNSQETRECNMAEKKDATTVDRNKIKRELAPLYLQMIEKCKQDGIAFRKATSADDYDAYTCVPMFVGNKYSTNAEDSVLVVGRAVNGWDVDWPTDANEMVNNVLDQTFELDSINNLPEQDGYYFSRSRFFLVIKEIVKRLGANEDEWSSKFAWSNLYKVAPALNGNPNGKVQHSQREIAIQILKKEIELLQPKYIVFVTGYDFTTWSWRNSTLENTFEKEFGLQQTDKYGAYVEGATMYNGSKVVVACRPEMKSVKEWTDSVFLALNH